MKFGPILKRGGGGFEVPPLGSSTAFEPGLTKIRQPCIPLSRIFEPNLFHIGIVIQKNLFKKSWQILENLKITLIQFTLNTILGQSL